MSYFYFGLCYTLGIGEIMKKSRGAKRRQIILVPLCFFIIGYFLWSAGYYAFKIYSLNKEQSTLKAELTDLQTEETSLKSEITRLQDPEYIARYARENYLYSKDGEYIIKLDGEDTETVEEGFDYKEYIPYAIATGVGIVIIIIITHNVRKKNKKKGTK